LSEGPTLFEQYVERYCSFGDNTAACSPEAALYRGFCVDFVPYCAEDKSRP